VEQAHGGRDSRLKVMHALSVWTSWQFEPLHLLPVIALAVLYGVRVRRLALKGEPPPVWRVLLFATGILLLLVAAASPIAEIGEERLLTAHMIQHVLLGDLAPLALLGGLTRPILRPALAVLYRLRFLANPVVALTLWAFNLYLWHLPFLYDAAVRHEAVHALEHACFLLGGTLMWLPVLETIPAPEWFGTAWKAGYIVVVRLVETVLGNVFLFSGGAFYATYQHPAGTWGIHSPASDQSIAGAVMMIEGSLVTIAALAWLFLRLASEGELRQQLLERGLDPRTVRRAVRYGRGKELEQAR
jgi:cytochrome c oxidase assembly factor CtaG